MTVNGTFNFTQELIDSYNAADSFAVEWQGWISLGVAIAQIPLLVWTELGRPCHRPDTQWKQAFSRINIALVAIGLSNGFSNVFYYISTNLEDPVPQLVYNNLADLSLVVLYSALFLYSATRGGPIFKSLFPRGVKWIPIYNYLFFTVQLVQLGLFISVFCLDLDNGDNMSFLGEQIGISAVFLLQVFEVFVSFSYCAYLWKMSKASVLVQDMEISLMIISKIGIISNIFGFFWFISFLMVYYYNWSESKSFFENDIQIAIDLYMSLQPNLYVFLQLWMKYALRRQEWAEKGQQHYRIDNGKAVNTATTGDMTMKNSFKFLNRMGGQSTKGDDVGNGSGRNAT